jgi:hypothetical protein
MCNVFKGIQRLIFFITANYLAVGRFAAAAVRATTYLLQLLLCLDRLKLLGILELFSSNVGSAHHGVIQVHLIARAPGDSSSWSLQSCDCETVIPVAVEQVN